MKDVTITPESSHSGLMMIEFLNLSLPTLNGNLALDEALLLEAEGGASAEVLRIWNWPRPAVVLGAGGVIADDVDDEACAMERVPLARRASGGGTVMLGRGCLCFTLVLEMDRQPELTNIGASYRLILSRTVEALAALQPNIEIAGISDLCLAGRKISGNAQQRKRRFVLHHGTLLHGFDFSLISRCLKLPPRRPDYRADREHEDFLGNLPDRPIEIADCLRRSWNAERVRTDWPADRVHRLVDEKYALGEWIYRR